VSDRLLVVGAGPTGLAMALQAAAHGADVRVVDRRPDAFRPSRALMVHARTLEVLRPLGVVEELLDRSDTAPRARLHLGRRTVPVELGRFDLPDTPYPHLTLVRQMDVETVLSGALADAGVPIERGVELLDVHDGADEATAVLRTPDGVERDTVRAVVGCDGVESTVRRLADIGWCGSTYDREVVLADLDLEADPDLEPGVAHVVAGRQGLVFLFALGEQAPWRLLATRAALPDTPGPGRPGPPVPADVLQRMLDEAGLGVRIGAVAWSSAVRLQHRMATAFRSGRLFLAGDAAHASSPAGGQGMNTGLQDAVNLGWKLALAPSSTAPHTLLDSYGTERRPVDRRVLALTHALFWGESSTGAAAALLRGTLAPLAAPLVPAVLNRRRLVAEGAKVLAQLRTHYRDSALSVEAGPGTAEVRAGDRLPDGDAVVDGRRTRLHEVIARPGVHVLLDQDARDPGLAGDLVHVHRLRRPGSGALVIRPDGYVGMRAGEAGDPAVRWWLGRVGLGQDGSATARAASRRRAARAASSE
jgi:2-polyprenyl-6-methoxyphenol hydroxylase-like FAD-dependent oxidoreductase